METVEILKKEIEIWRQRNEAQAEKIARLENVTIPERIDRWAQMHDETMARIAANVCRTFSESTTDDGLIAVWEACAMYCEYWVDNYDPTPYEAPTKQ